MEHNSSQFQMLSACKNGYVGACDCCQQFNFSYNNVLLHFSEEEMMNFFDWLMAYRHPVRILFHCRMDVIGFIPVRKTISSWYIMIPSLTISNLFAEVKIMLEVRKIMS